MTKYVFQQSAFSADEAVSVAPYASFTFTDAATGDESSLWEDEDGATRITGNSVVADENGYVKAYLTSGIYDVLIVSGSLSQQLRDVVVGADLAGTAATAISAYNVASVSALRSIEPTTNGQSVRVRGTEFDGAITSSIEYRYVASNATWPDDGERVIVTTGGKRWIATTAMMTVPDTGVGSDGLEYAINIKPVNPYCIIGEVQCATISGGGRESAEQRIGTFAGSLADMSIIGGGYDNVNNMLAGSILGGAHHFLHAWSNGGSGEAEWDDSNHGTIAGGSYGEIWFAKYAHIGGGTRLKIMPCGLRSRVSGSATRVWMQDTFTSVTPTVGPFTYTDTVDTATKQAVVLWHVATQKPRLLAYGVDYTTNEGTKQITLTSALLTTGYELRVYGNPAASDHSVIGGGGYNSLNGGNNYVAGYGNTVIGSASTISGGKYCYVNGNYQTIVGGDSNEIRAGGNGTGQKNTIGGGSDIIIDGFTTCTGNTSSGGEDIQVFGSNHAVGGGKGHRIGAITYTSSNNTIGGGLNNTIGECIGAAIPGGRSNEVTGDYGTAWGYSNKATAGRATAHGYKAVAKYQSGRTWADGDIAIAGDAQGHELIYKGITVGSGTVALSREGGSQTIVLDDYSAVMFHILVVGRNVANNAAASYRIVGCMRRDNGAGTVVFVGTPTVTAYEESGVSSAWGATVAAWTAGGGFRINADGTAGVTVHWAATVSLVAVKTA